MRNGESVNYTAETAIPAYTIVKFGANDGGIALATAATDLVIGCIGRIPAAIGDRIDIIRDDFAEVQLNGTVTRGQKLTSDGSGKGVAAAPTTGSNVHIIGIAESSGVAGDIIWVNVNLSVMQG